MEPREYTVDEVREKFLDAVRNIVEYWKNVENVDYEDRLGGVAFSILVLMDGGQIDIPEFILAPNPHPEDKDYLIGEDENYFPENYQSDINCNIGGYLHELFHKRE